MFDIIEDGWQAFDLEIEYRKMLHYADEWRITHANKDYSLCANYPTVVVVPKSIPDESLAKIAQFRCLGRFPVLSYVHKQNKAVIVRSGQPMTGPSNKRCKEDERLITAMVGNKRGYIIDTRSVNVAQLAKAKGGGHESEAFYPLLRRVHRPIDRYNTLLDSYQKLLDACNDKNCTTEKWLSRLENSNWLRHIKDVLTCACLAAQCIDQEGASILVHGSEGLDSTLQVTSLAQIILDPDCRTILGFEALIEREWLKAGHPFATRCRNVHAGLNNNGMSTYDKGEQSPVFLLFLDCVYQIYQQFPCSFEFNDEFLVMLIEHAYGSQFGTFLANNPKESYEMRVPFKTTSLWSYINRPQELNKYINPVYDPNNQAIWPSVAPQSLELWDSYFLKNSIDTSLRYKAKQMLYHIRSQQKEYRAEIARKKKLLDELQQSNQE